MLFVYGLLATALYVHNLCTFIAFEYPARIGHRTQKTVNKNFDRAVEGWRTDIFGKIQ